MAVRKPTKAQRYEALLRSIEEKIRSAYSMSRNPKVNKMLESVFNDINEFNK